MAKKTLQIDDKIHSQMKTQLSSEKISLNGFAEDAITYVLQLYKQGYRIIGGNLYKFATQSPINNVPEMIPSAPVIPPSETVPTEKIENKDIVQPVKQQENVSQNLASDDFMK